MSDTIDDLLEQLKQYNNSHLWDYQDIANYLKLAKSTVQSHVVCKPDFPPAIRINGSRRWEPDDIKRWARLHREAA